MNGVFQDIPESGLGDAEATGAPVPVSVPVLSKAFLWWSRHREGSGIPRRADLDIPFSISHVLPMVTLIAPGAGGPTVAIYGTRLADMDGVDRTGHPISALPMRLFPDAPAMIHALLHDGVAPRLCRGIRIHPSWPGRVYVLHTCFFPMLRNDGKREVLGISALGEEVRPSDSYRLGSV